MNQQQIQGIWTTLRQALVLDSNLYESARNIRKHQQIALTIVLLAALSHAVGSAAILLINRITGPLLLLAMVIDALSIIGGYYLWTFTIWKIGQWLKAIDPTYGELLSPIGFAYAPQVLNFLTLIPLLGRPIELLLAVWSLLAVIVAVRQGLDISTRRSIVICLIGFPLIQIAIGSIQVLQQKLMSG